MTPVKLTSMILTPSTMHTVQCVTLPLLFTAVWHEYTFKFPELKCFLYIFWAVCHGNAGQYTKLIETDCKAHPQRKLIGL